MSPHCQFSDLGPFRLRIFSAQVGNRTSAHGNESNPLEISMSSAMKGEPGLATGLTTLGALHPFIRAWKSGHRNLSSEDRTGARAPSASYCSTEGVAPLHTAPPVPVTAPPVPVLRHQCRYCATSAGTAPPVPGLRHQCRCCATSAGTAPPVPVLRHQHRSCATSAGTAPPVPL